jgi:hypothetical protein
VSLASEREPLLEPNFFFHFGTTKKIRSAYGLELTVLIFLTLYSVVVVGQGIISSRDELLIVFVAWGAATSTTQVELVSLERIGPGGVGQGHMVVRICPTSLVRHLLFPICSLSLLGL